jgi:hypothetical protein
MVPSSAAVAKSNDLLSRRRNSRRLICPAKLIQNAAANSGCRVTDKIAILRSAIITHCGEQTGHRNIFQLIGFKIARQAPLHMTNKWPDQRQSSLQEAFEISFIAKGNSVLHILVAVGAPFIKK